MTIEWKNNFAKTWLSWPKFDIRDHQFCPTLDTSNRDQDFHFESENLPFRFSRERKETQPTLRTWNFTELLDASEIQDLQGVHRWELPE